MLSLFRWLFADLAFGLALGLAACSPAPAPVASSSRAPSNPGAPEGVDPVAAVHVTTTADAGAVTYA